MADIIAAYDQYVDESVALWSIPGFCWDCHFCSEERTNAHVEAAVEKRNPYLFGATLHQVQDYYSHWREGYDSFSSSWRGPHGHEDDSRRAGVCHTPVVGGEYCGRVGRTEEQSQDFYQGWHNVVVVCVGYVGCRAFERHGPSPSPYGAHPRENVIADIHERNPGIDLNGVSDDQLIDLFLRKDPGISSTYSSEAQRVEERQWFGLNTDWYFPGSTRDKLMEQHTRQAIWRFLSSIAMNSCAIDWSKPTDAKIKEFLSQ